MEALTEVVLQLTKTNNALLDENHALRMELEKYRQSAVPEKAKRVLKAEKIEDPATCETQEQLGFCTVIALNQFCKDYVLRKGGSKKELIDRIWRHLQGESTDDDQGRKTKPVAEPVAEPVTAPVITTPQQVKPRTKFVPKMIEPEI